MYVILLKAYFQSLQQPNWLNKAVNYLFAFTIIMLGLFPIVFAFLPQAKVVNHVVLKVVILELLFLPMAYIYMKNTGLRVHMLIYALIIGRIGFDLFVLEHRAYDSWMSELKKSAIELAETTQDKQVYMHAESSIYHHDNKIFLDRTAYYYSTHANKIINRNPQIIPGEIYVTKPDSLINKDYTKIFDLYTNSYTMLPVVIFKE